MHELNNDWNRAYKKSARIVGDVIGKYHPHGDTAVYDTIVRMAQNFSLRYMLVDGQGNFGSVDGDNAAAMRYTEIRLSKIAHEMLHDIDKETVDFDPNYDGSEKEPAILPARIPNLLINGSSGIAVGMATNIPPHNLNEIVDGCLHLLRNPQATVDELIELIPAPDFPTAGIIYGIQGVREGYRTGRGRVVMRARTHFEDIDRGQRQAIIVDELPYQVNKRTLLERIAELVTDKKIEGISDIRDESDKSGMRVVIELKRNEVPEVVLNNLYKNTQLQDTCMNMVALVDARAFDAARQALLHCGQQLLQRNRLFQEIQRANLGCLDRGVDGGMARHHDHGHRELALRRPFLEQRHAIGIGHPDIEQHEIRSGAQAVFARLLRVLGDFDHMAFVAQDFREQFPDSHFVIDYEDRCHTSPLNPTQAFHDGPPS